MGSIIFRRIRGRVVALFQHNNVVMKLPEKLQNEATWIRHTKAVNRALETPNPDLFLKQKEKSTALAKKISDLAKKLKR